MQIPPPLFFLDASVFIKLQHSIRFLVLSSLPSLLQDSLQSPLSSSQFLNVLTYIISSPEEKSCFLLTKWQSPDTNAQASHHFLLLFYLIFPVSGWQKVKESPDSCPDRAGHSLKKKIRRQGGEYTLGKSSHLPELSVKLSFQPTFRIAVLMYKTINRLTSMVFLK